MFDKKTITTSVQDRNGAIWFMRQKGELLKFYAGKVAPLLLPDEPNPFLHGGRLHEVLTDSHGNVLLRRTDRAHIHQYVFIPARLPLVKGGLSLTGVQGDTALVAADSRSSEDFWITWRLDEEPWSDLIRTREISLRSLPPGRHVLEARTCNTELTLSPKAVGVEFEIAPGSSPGTLVYIQRYLNGNANAHERDAARHALKAEGKAALPGLRGMREKAGEKSHALHDALEQEIDTETRR